MNKFKYLSLILLLGCLTSCTHVSRQDGPPAYNVDVSHIPDAVPKVEPRAKYGNMASYQVFGKRYYTLPPSYHYDTVGIASWYGTKFHAQRTSSGEPYNMLGMTAAHKTLSLPTYVEVTNLKNHRKVIVKVNDRGPFESNRIIDLSYAAAKKLGMLGHGTALVHVKAINPMRFNTSIPPLNQNLYLQVGAFRSRDGAERLQQHLTTVLATPIVISHPTANTALYRVKVGPINDTATANRISDQLKNLGIKPNKTTGV